MASAKTSEVYTAHLPITKSVIISNVQCTQEVTKVAVPFVPALLLSGALRNLHRRFATPLTFIGDGGSLAKYGYFNCGGKWLSAIWMIVRVQVGQKSGP